jgi:saccharopine dehydrogenase-like NADP-dependent oxidoreductase
MKNILLFGAGKSATCLIEYLVKTCSEKNWKLTICDANVHTLRDKFQPSLVVNTVQIDVFEADVRRKLVQQADLVISLLPPALHILVARECVSLAKTLLTASYVDDKIKGLEKDLLTKDTLFICELGLDPGIDHMSAMQIIHRIQKAGGIIHVFKSHTGGLVAPESDNNPWHYKISWNPANVIRAGSSGAVYLESGQIKRRGYPELFENNETVQVPPMGEWAWYPNRDSLTYILVYGLESAHTFIRTTLRHPHFCTGWKNIIKAGLTKDDIPVDSSVLTIADWTRPLLLYTDDSNRHLYDQLGLFNSDNLPVRGTSAYILQTIIEKKWKMAETDHDMILMLHELEYELNGKHHTLQSSLIVKGENSSRTAMAKTVGLPLGITAKLILEDKIRLKGLHIPIIREIYEPVLKELELEGILFTETLN